MISQNNFSALGVVFNLYDRKKQASHDLKKEAKEANHVMSKFLGKVKKFAHEGASLSFSAILFMKENKTYFQYAHIVGCLVAALGILNGCGGDVLGIVNNINKIASSA